MFLPPDGTGREGWGTRRPTLTEHCTGPREPARSVLAKEGAPPGMGTRERAPRRRRPAGRGRPRTRASSYSPAGAGAYPTDTGVYPTPRPGSTAKVRKPYYNNIEISHPHKMIYKSWNMPDDSTEENSLPTITQQDTAAQVVCEAPSGHRSGAWARRGFSGSGGAVASASALTDP